jgi:hypothetical protein
MIGVLGFDSRRGLGISYFTTVSRTALGPTQWVKGALSLEVKRPARKADYSPPLVPRSKNEWSYTSTPQYAFMAWCSFQKKHRVTLPLPLQRAVSDKLPKFSLCLTKCRAMKTYTGVEVYLHAFLTTALNGVSNKFGLHMNWGLQFICKQQH